MDTLTVFLAARWTRWVPVGLVLLTACSDSSGPKMPASSGSTHTLLTDGPFPYSRVARADIYIVSVSASLSPDTSASSGSFVMLATPNRRINLLALQGGLTDELGAVDVPKGAITAVRVVIDTDSSSLTLKDGRVLTGSSSPGIHWQSSAGRPVLNALIQEQIMVPDSGAQIVIDYDLGQSFIPPQEIDSTSTDSGFIFSPVLRAADATRTGSISGSVVGGAALGFPVADASLRLYLGNPANPENTWGVLQTARTDAQGAFKFAYVTRSDWWSQFPALSSSVYIVAVDPPPGLGLGRTLRQPVMVSAQQQTTLGTLVLP